MLVTSEVSIPVHRTQLNLSGIFIKRYCVQVGVNCVGNVQFNKKRAASHHRFRFSFLFLYATRGIILDPLGLIKNTKLHTAFSIVLASLPTSIAHRSLIKLHAPLFVKFFHVWMEMVSEFTHLLHNTIIQTIWRYTRSMPQTWLQNSKIPVYKFCCR